MLDYNIDGITLDVNSLVSEIEKLELEQQANNLAKKKLEDGIRKLIESNEANKEALDIATHAIEILREVSDEAVSKAYKFLEESLNAALKRMFRNTTRQIRLHEYTRSNQYPQLEIELIVANNKKRSLKSDSGHGIAQIVSLLSILSLIVITNSRRILVIDEVVSGLSVHNRRILTDILWQFTHIGFQFIVNEHGYVPKGSRVYHMEMVGDVSGVKETYISNEGVYLDDGDYTQNDEEPDELDVPEEIKITSSGKMETTNTEQSSVENTDSKIVSI